MLDSQTIQELSAEENSKERKITVPQLKDRAAWIRFCLGDLPETTRDTNSQIVDCRKRDLADNLGIDIDLEEGEEKEEFVENKMMNIVGSEDQDDMDIEDTEDEKTYPTWAGLVAVRPVVSLLLQFDQVLTQRVLSYLISWLDESDRLNVECSQWLYAMLARIEKPLHRDTVAAIRQLYRKCCVLRCKLDKISDGFNADLASLNVLISISGYYFGQGEQYDGAHDYMYSDEEHHKFTADEEEDEGEEDDDDIVEDEDQNGLTFGPDDFHGDDTRDGEDYDDDA